MLSFNQTKQFIILAIIVVLVIGVSMFLNSRKSGKWVCKDNIWVAQGKPTEPRPGLYCK